MQIRGTVHAPDGEIAVSGAQSVVRCGMFAQTIKISGAESHVEVDEACIRH
ncbi:hypothetical protein GCM10010166_42260 [Couchioplanes caeruleus subsp. azureus]|nr:hypothetical protein GCM10010166_42260 [Couchioplanes caeruleus subsp. azureus]